MSSEPSSPKNNGTNSASNCGPLTSFYVVEDNDLDSTESIEILPSPFTIRPSMEEPAPTTDDSTLDKIKNEVFNVAEENSCLRGLLMQYNKQTTELLDFLSNHNRQVGCANTHNKTVYEQVHEMIIQRDKQIEEKNDYIKFLKEERTRQDIQKKAEGERMQKLLDQLNLELLEQEDYKISLEKTVRMMKEEIAGFKVSMLKKDEELEKLREELNTEVKYIDNEPESATAAANNGKKEILQRMKVIDMDNKSTNKKFEISSFLLPEDEYHAAPSQSYGRSSFTDYSHRHQDNYNFPAEEVSENEKNFCPHCSIEIPDLSKLIEHASHCYAEQEAQQLNRTCPVCSEVVPFSEDDFNRHVNNCLDNCG